MPVELKTILCTEFNASIPCKSEIETHENRTDNPHQTTADQTGALSDGSIPGVGIVVKTGAGAYANRSIAVNGGLLVSNSSGISGNPTLSADFGTGAGEVAEGNHTHPRLATDHNELGGLQGGDPYSSIPEYYHLSTAEIAALNNKVDTSYVEEVRTYLNAGGITQPVITTGTGTITVPTMDCFLFSTPNNSGAIRKYTIPQLTNYVVAANIYYYITVNYNAGNPIYSVITDNTLINHSDIIGVAQVYHEVPLGGAIDVYRIFYYGPYALGLANKLSHNLIHTHRFGWQEGLALSETGTRYIVTGQGTVWYDGLEILVPATNSNTIHAATFYYHVGGVWYASNMTSYNNTQYDNGTNLVTIASASSYAVNWVYVATSAGNNSAYVVLGSAEHTKLSDAQASQPPLSLPVIFAKQTILVGRIIVKKNDPTATQIDSAFNLSFTSSGIVNHNDTVGLQGGIPGQYYHFSAIENTTLLRGFLVNSTVSNAGTLTLTSNSARFQIITGTTTHNIILPAANAIGAGNAIYYDIKNRSTGVITITRAGADTIQGAISIMLSSNQSVKLMSDSVSEWEIL